MKTTLILGTIAASIILSGCGSSGSSTNNNGMNTGNTNGGGGQTARFTKMTMMGDTVEQDNQTKLEWVGSVGSNGTTACQPHAAATTEMADIAAAKAHCDALVFASHEDWRVATAAEHAAFITGMNAAGMTPYYANPACPRLIGTDGTNATAVNTHNSNPIGAMTPWATLLNQSATNFGVKCVRSF